MLLTAVTLVNDTLSALEPDLYLLKLLGRVLKSLVNKFLLTVKKLALKSATVFCQAPGADRYNKSDLFIKIFASPGAVVPIPTLTSGSVVGLLCKVILSLSKVKLSQDRLSVVGVIVIHFAASS